MTVALLLGGGAPVLPFMAGALEVLDEKGVDFTVVSTAGAGMVVGLLYAAPKGEGDIKELRRQALRNTVNLGVHDAIYDAFPVNFKVFHKPGPWAEVYTKWMQMLPKPDFGDSSVERFMHDWAAMMSATFCPTDLGPLSHGLCQPAPFIEEIIDFSKLKDFPAEFYMNAYCLETEEMELFERDEITTQHFQAALAFPFIYSPFKLNGKTYIEGSAIDTLCFEGVLKHLFEPKDEKKTEKNFNLASGDKPGVLYQPKTEKPRIETLVIFDVLGSDKMIRAPRSLYHSWVRSIMVPLVPIAKDDVRLFELMYKDLYELNLLKIPFDPEDYSDYLPDEPRYDPEEFWSDIIEWSYSNLSRLYAFGRAAGEKFFDDHRALLLPGPKAAKPADKAADKSAA